MALHLLFVALLWTAFFFFKEIISDNQSYDTVFWAKSYKYLVIWKTKNVQDFSLATISYKANPTAIVVWLKQC